MSCHLRPGARVLVADHAGKESPCMVLAEPDHRGLVLVRLTDPRAAVHPTWLAPLDRVRPDPDERPGAG